MLFRSKFGLNLNGGIRQLRARLNVFRPLGYGVESKALLDSVFTLKMALQGKIAKQRTILDLKVIGMDFEGMKCN